MTKMIEVPEEHLLALKARRASMGSARDLLPHVDTLIACLPKPIEVGSRVRAGGTEATVLAIADDEAWLRYDDVGHGTWRIASLEVIE